MPNRRFHEIDLLRGLACLAVVAFHYLFRGQEAGWISTQTYPAVGALARHGYLGVHLFFIISGFVIFMSAQGSTVRSFAASRVARLYPALWAAAPLTAAIAWAFHSTPFNVSLPQLAVNMTMLAHWFKVEFVDGAYWSLAVELQFYLLIALAVGLNGMRRAEWLVAGWLAVSAVNALRPMYPLEFWLAAKWAPLFAAGICFYLLSTQGPSRARLILIAAAYLLALVYEVGPHLKNPPAAPDLVSAWVSAGAITAFFALFCWIAVGRANVRPSPLSVWSGLMTYPVYLLHQNIGYVLLEALAPSGQPFWLRLLLVAATVGASAWAIVKFVEKPLAPWLRKMLSPPSGQAQNSGQRGNAAPQ